MKKKRILNILFYLLLFFLLSAVFLNIDDFKDYIYRKEITNFETYNKYKNNKFVTINLKNIEKTRYALEEDGIVKSKIYITKLGDEYFLLNLKDDTNINKKIKGYFSDINKEVNEIRNEFVEDENLNINNLYFTNLNISTNEKILLLKIYSFLLLIFLSFLLVIYNFIRISLNQTKVHN